MSHESYPTEASFSGRSDFNVQAYLDERDARDSFVMVELGHGNTPVDQLQHNFTGQRGYVGIEAWLRRPQEADLPRPDNANPNRFFIEQNFTDYFRDEYNPKTALPDGAADEVFVSNVFGDPMIRRMSSRTDKFLAETKRLAGPNGTIVIRETITPFPDQFDEALAAVGGLKIVHYVGLVSHPTQWDALESRFSSDPLRRSHMYDHRSEEYYLSIKPTH